jgi:hypothetical protein
MGVFPNAFTSHTQLTRLGADKTNAEVMGQRGGTHGAKEMYERLQKLIMHTSMSISYFCPICEEPTPNVQRQQYFSRNLSISVFIAALLRSKQESIRMLRNL